MTMLKAEDEEKDKKENSKEGDEPKTEEVDDEGTHCDGYKY